jgi:MacB-like periplasmic core domain
MIPLPCRLIIAAAAWIVPKPKRTEWKQEWHAELWHRAEAGTAFRDLFDCACGAFRDATWFLQNERKRHGFDLFRRPLRTELAFLLAALLICALSGALTPPKSRYANAKRLVAVNHASGFAGGRDSMFRGKYVALVRLETETLEDLTIYRVLRERTPGLLVSRNFLAMFGASPLLGRGFNEHDPENVAILSEDFWRTWFHADPRVIGASEGINGKQYTIIGVMPRQFWFLSDKLRFYAPLEQSKETVGFVGLLAPGQTVQSAQSELCSISGEVDSRWASKRIEAQPLVRDPRMPELLFGAIAALACALLGIGFIAIKRMGGPRYCLLLGARVATVLGGLGLLRMVELRLTGPYTAYTLFHVWIYLLICFAATCLLIIDHRGRCLVCLAKLRMPAPIGVWSSQILDQPVTEYVCPAGHGALVVAGTGDAPDHWTVLDETWQDLFAHTEH